MISLHTHTTYSFLDGYGTPEQYIERLKEIGCNTMAITDHGNIFGHRPFYRAFKKAGIKLIPGCEMYIANGEDKYYHLTVLAQNNNGYRNLCQLVSLSNQEDHFNRRPLVSLDEMVAHKDGLIILTGCFGDGMPHRAYQEDKASVAGVLRKLKKLFGDKLYLEVQHTDKEELDFMRLVGKMENIPLVATTDTHYPRKEDYEIEDVMLCIGLKAKVKDLTRIKLPSNLWLMSNDEALEAGFNYEEIDTTYDIADMCDVELPILKPVAIDGAKETMIEMIRKNSVRLGDRVKNDLYRSRYQYEMSIIDKLGLHAYFVVMADVIEHFKKQGVLVGPGRGSSGGSLICYLLGIIEIDPIQHDLKFERFMDLNRKDYPDIDTDFPPEAHDKVVKYLQDKYGHNRVGRLCSFTTYKGSSIFWDIARTHGIDTSVAKSMGKAIPKIVDDTTDVAAIMAEPAVKNIVNDWPVFELAEKLEGQIRQAGKHASGYAISPEDLSGIVATTNSETLSVDKTETEAMGLLKLDILSLTCLDMMQNIIDSIGISNKKIYTLDPIDDKVFAAFNDLHVAGIFQFEGAAVKKVLRHYQVRSLEDLAFVNAVARPGAALTLDSAMIPPKPFLPMVYKNRYFVYQEELMSILAYLHFGWDEITTFRKLVSKKKVNELEEKYHTKFIDRCMNVANISWAEADKFWAIVNKCGEYMFNKCISGDTKIRRSRGDTTIKELYLTMKDKKWAIENGKLSNHNRLNRMGWGKTLSVDSDNRVRLDNIVDIVYNGKKSCYRLTGSDGKFVEATKDHRFLTPHGWKTVEEIKPGDLMFMAGKPEKCENKYNFYKQAQPLNSAKGVMGFQKRPLGHSVAFKMARKEMLQAHDNTCMRCGKKHQRMETAHLDGDRENNARENLMNMCPGCHKRHDYASGRKKVFSKGLPLIQIFVVSKEFVGEKDTYDIEMESETHNFIANGFVSHNSHAVAYAMLAYQAMWLKVNYPDVFAREYLNSTKSDVKRRALLREHLVDGGKIIIFDESNPTGNFQVKNGTITGSLLAIKGIGPAKLKNIMAGKMDKAVVKAIEGAKTNPAVYAPWACLDDFGNRYKIGSFPEGQFMVTARVWEVKDNACIIEDINGAEKVYFEPKYVSVSDGKVYKLAITKFNSSHIDSARIVE